MKEERSWFNTALSSLSRFKFKMSLNLDLLSLLQIRWVVVVEGHSKILTCKNSPPPVPPTDEGLGDRGINCPQPPLILFVSHTMMERLVN